MTTQVSHGASGAIRRFAGWVGRGSVGYPLFDQYKPQGRSDVDGYWETLSSEASSLETLFAVFVNNLELDEEGEPTNEKYAERRAATFLFSYMTGELPPGEPDIGGDEATTY
ncbi:DUF7677 family protein [Actinopolymorpha pittospori]|uniref:DUF7677 domain-containing protein n=1 Tax=Actinopolymorpha pittospori TaxID=648752 RepID=A0A927MSU3_9ACTN|nr:hypothetical protein [Actinopolymorpha pittospori]MBE1605696.1 hypothetical protein [Actinopolymorpha pittospori]